MNLYRQAQAFPRTLRGRNTLARSTDLARTGIGPAGIRWRTGRGRLVRAHRGAYLIGLELPDLLDRVRAALAVSPPHAVLGYQTAGALLGFGVAESADVHIVVPLGGPFPQRPGIVVHQSAIPVGEPVLVQGLPCVPAVRCALDLARTLDPALALSTLDAALSAGVCTGEDLRAEQKFHSGLRGIRQARDLIALADGRAQCRQESHLRLILHEGGVRGLVPQLPVTDGAVTDHLDLADPVHHIGVEYDGGSPYDGGTDPDRDRRQERLAGNGWRLRTFTDDDIDHRPADIVRTVRAARRMNR